ncbi:MAG: 50S ribosomal protein L15 [Euryarchaeota archaeon]|nr:50S ribosomal protein L15 [Euryarchaeota archaeon]MDP6363316.1 uL15m family ribosomal protein [Candidatus Poseidoniia archaeon]MDP6658190.1 uL15m family ribosomal protein [Candidatus Poseidoniia archaeon]MDP6846152.1 uL15m family ribosomal protein [Candidatus Poseidoniia archaeon]MDP7007352.1 uL15m family ribosomal protein [Candidatus Poseidoniia archaeon]
MATRKSMRRGRTRGRGHKKGRGAGLRGGRGNAGAHKTKRVMYERVGRVWGRSGFTRPPAVVAASAVLNLKLLEESLDHWVADGSATQKGKLFSVDLGPLGFDKLLSTGDLSRPCTITVSAASARAIQKVEAAGGEVQLG